MVLNHTTGDYKYYCVFIFKDGARIMTEARSKYIETPERFAEELVDGSFHTFTEHDGSCTVINMSNVMAVKIMNKEKEDEYDD